MKVIINGVVHDSEKEMIIVHLSKSDKNNIKNMSKDADLYCSFPDDKSAEEKLKISRKLLFYKNHLSSASKEKLKLIHLCDTCNNSTSIPVCLPENKEDLLFGDGKGKGNIIECRNYNKDLSTTSSNEGYGEELYKMDHQ